MNESYLKAFVGGNTSYYLYYWRLVREGKRASFNLHAFLFGIFWVIYRRM
ncbi:hypothetical protein LGH70_06380 [Hymenobacter sp. BT635]|uniref:Uncharacterized protein n=1 Tax=Hymenobacter nitidus TaxID=2880929 RepID=A0ABS8A9X3_9BACT|nr:hypothetical protein [Hymenobacter nitidus]MCB2377201.1 hypothetical protein [Hymenobacter nitidus]